MPFSYRNSGLMVAGKEMGQQTKPGDLVLDPTGGSCTTAVAAFKLGRRFIIIDQQPLIHEIAAYRLQQVIDGGDYPHQRKPCGHSPAINMVDMSFIPFGHSLPDPYIWDNGDSWVIIGDCYQVMHLIPDGIIDLIYCDPPFASQRTYKDKLKMPGSPSDGVEVKFDDKWDSIPLPEAPHLEDYVAEHGDEEGLRRWREDKASAERKAEAIVRVAAGMRAGTHKGRRQGVYCRHCLGEAWHKGAAWGRDRIPILDDPFGLRR